MTPTRNKFWCELITLFSFSKFVLLPRLASGGLVGSLKFCSQDHYPNPTGETQELFQGAILFDFSNDIFRSLPIVALLVAYYFHDLGNV